MEAETSASRLERLQRHREARNLLVQSTQSRRPQSAHAPSAFAAAAAGSRPRSAAEVHFRATPKPLKAQDLAGSTSVPRKRPMSAFPGRASASPVGRRPATASTRGRFASEKVEKKMEFPSPGRVGKTPESDGAAARDDLPSQGPHLLAFASRLGPAPPLPPLPPKLEAGSSRGGSEAEEELDDFTPEERRLEQESEEALKQLEALNAAVEALRMKLEVAKDDAECSAAQLLQLNSAADSWAKAAEESRQELKDRELRLQELLAVLPAEDPPVETEESDKHLPGERPPRVLQQQTDRLQEQVEAQQSLLLQRLEERRALEAQVEVLCKERDEQKAVQQKARAACRAAESQMKVKEEALSAFARQRKDLEWQSLRLRGEVRGLKARLAAQAAQAKERPPREAASVTAERHRRTSLKLQHEVAELWEALRQYREKAQRDCEAVVSKQDLAKEELLQAFKSRDSTRYLVALEAALEAEVEPQDIPCVYSLHRVSGSFEVHEIDLRRRTFSAQLCFILDYTSSMKTQVQEVKSAVPRIIEAVRQLHLPLTPNARVDLEMSCVAYNDWDEDTFRLGRPVVAIFQGQEIRHAHGEPLLREEDFNLGGEFTRKAEALEAWIDQGLGHGGFVPEELTGALLAASYLPWNAENESEPSACAKLAVVITDAPCHGKAYSAVAHDVFCDRSTGLTCSGCPEVPLRRLREQGVQVAIFHTGEGPAVSMCEKLCASEPDLIHEKVDPSATAQKLVNLLEGKLKLQPLSYVLKTFSLGQPETPHLDLALAHDMEVEDGDGQKERYKIGLDGLLFLGFPERNPKVVVRRPLDSKLDPLYERRSELVELPRVYAGCGCHELRMWPLRGEG